MTQTNKTGYSVETRIRGYCFVAAVVVVRVLFPFHQLMVLEFIIIIVIIIITIIIIIIYSCISFFRVVYIDCDD